MKEKILKLFDSRNSEDHLVAFHLMFEFLDKDEIWSIANPHGDGRVTYIAGYTGNLLDSREYFEVTGNGTIRYIAFDGRGIWLQKSKPIGRATVLNYGKYSTVTHSCIGRYNYEKNYRKAVTEF